MRKKVIIIIMIVLVCCIAGFLLYKNPFRGTGKPQGINTGLNTGTPPAKEQTSENNTPQMLPGLILSKDNIVKSSIDLPEGNAYTKLADKNHLYIESLSNDYIYLYDIKSGKTTEKFRVFKPSENSYNYTNALKDYYIGCFIDHDVIKDGNYTAHWTVKAKKQDNKEFKIEDKTITLQQSQEVYWDAPTRFDANKDKLVYNSQERGDNNNLRSQLMLYDFTTGKLSVIDSIEDTLNLRYSPAFISEDKVVWTLTKTKDNMPVSGVSYIYDIATNKKEALSRDLKIMHPRISGSCIIAEYCNKDEVNARGLVKYDLERKLWNTIYMVPESPGNPSDYIACYLVSGDYVVFNTTKVNSPIYVYKLSENTLYDIPPLEKSSCANIIDTYDNTVFLSYISDGLNLQYKIYELK